MKVNRQKLIESLDQVRPGLGTKDILEHTVNFHFSKNHLITSNDAVSVSLPFEGDIEASVRAEEFYQIVKEFDSEEIEITKKDNEVRLTGQKVKAGISISKTKLEPMAVDSDFLPIPKGLLEAWLFVSSQPVGT